MATRSAHSNGALRALVATPDFPPAKGGIELLMYSLVLNLHDVQPMVVALGGDAAKSFDSKGSLEVVRAARGGGRLHRLSVSWLNRSVLSHGCHFRPHVIVSGHAVTAPACAPLRTVRRVPVIQYLHSDECRHRPRLVRFAVRHADAVVAVSGYAKNLALAAGCPPDRIRVLHPGVDLPDPPRTCTRDRRPTVLTVARMYDEYKGHDLMIRALPLVRARVPDVQWVVIGEGPLRSDLESQARRSSLQHSVRFLGAVSDEERDSWFDRAHVFALPGRLPPEGVGGEGFGIVYLEAAAHGLPVVGGAAAGAVDAVDDGETGILVDGTDHVGLAKALTDLLLDPDRASALGSAGSDRAKRFTWARHAEGVERLMFELAEARD